MIKISVHELLHGFPRQPIFLTFLVKLGLLLVNVIDEVPYLSKRKRSCICLSYSGVGSIFVEEFSACGLARYTARAWSD